MDNDAIKPEIQNEGKTATLGDTKGKWYVCRYRTFTQDILRLETATEGSNITIFLPVAKKKSPDQLQNCKNSRPIIPGFIFVKGNINDIKSSPYLQRFHMMRTKGEVSRPVTISDVEMEPFIRIATILVENPDLIYSEDFVPSKHNIVEFTNVDNERTFAFLETLQGVSGGSLIVPVSQEEIARAINSPKGLSDIKLRPHTLCYKISAAETHFTIRHIVHGSKYDLDYINIADKRATTALQQFDKGETIDEKTTGKFREYLHRYRNATTDNIKFQAKISLMLYKCSTILRLREQSQQLKEKIIATILPEYDRYVERVRKDKRPTTQKNLQRFLKTFENTKAIEEASSECDRT